MLRHQLTIDDWHRWANDARFLFASQSGPGFHKVLEMDPYGTFYVRDLDNKTVYQGTDVFEAIKAYNPIYGAVAVENHDAHVWDWIAQDPVNRL